MITVDTKQKVRQAVAAARSRGLGVGLVPTMGYLHAGHLSLIRLSRELAGFTVVSLFVNPTQFGPGEDFERYPRDLERDTALAGSAGADLLFAPPVGEMYAPDASTYVNEESVSAGLCGASRPGHFRGVATVVAKLFGIVDPDVAVFGRKDLQQLTVLRRMARDLDMRVRIVGAPIVREADGLALSSRNVFLAPEERARAPHLQRGLAALAGRVRQARAGDDLEPLLAGARSGIEAATGGRIDYLTAVDSAMQKVSRAGDCRYIAAALFLGRTRLIDNVALRPDEETE
ncbi:pantoate--beta-alanine ligase [bacterium]|nr:pantoate--beta-alanine ligase [bacterium]